jgi:putative PIN family toxin of toxin-antitoxin system
MFQIVIDTNVLIAGLQSQFGASFRLLELMGTGKFEFSLSVPLALEYEAIAKRLHKQLALSISDIDDILDYIFSVAITRKIHYLWRPQLKDQNDDMILELAVNAQAEIIVTHNTKDFVGAEMFGIDILKPREFLKLVKEK